MTAAFNTLFDIVLPVLGLLVIACLVRAVIGPTIPDRIIAVNMVGTLVVIITCVLGYRMHEGYLTDVALIYVMLSFLAVVMLTKIYMGVYQEQRRRMAEEGGRKAEDHE